MPLYNINYIETEIGLLNKCITLYMVDLNNLFKSILISLGEDKEQLFKAHEFMLEDPEYLNSISQKIRNNINAEHAIKEISKHLKSYF